MTIPEAQIRFFAATDVGKVREHNEDNFLVDKKLSLFMVADGMGGHAAGEVASAIAVRTVHEELKREQDLITDYLAGATGAAKVTPKDIVALLEHAVQRACSKIHEDAQRSRATGDRGPYRPQRAHQARQALEGANREGGAEERHHARRRRLRAGRGRHARHRGAPRRHLRSR